MTTVIITGRMGRKKSRNFLYNMTHIILIVVSLAIISTNADGTTEPMIQEDVTPEVIPDETPGVITDETSEVTPDKTPEVILEETPGETPGDTPGVSFKEKPEKTPKEKAAKTPKEKAAKTATEKAGKTPKEQPVATHEEISPDLEEAKELLTAIATPKAGVQAALVDTTGLDPAPDEKVFSILEHGAKTDGKKDSVEAFMTGFRAACDHPGNARFLIPPGKYLLSQVIFSGPCAGPSPIVVQIAGEIMAMPDISMYPSPEWVTFTGINGLVIVGGGSFNGQGEKFWKNNDCESNKNCARLPASIVLKKTTNALVRSITSINPMGFHFFVTNCTNLKMLNINISAPGDSPNTDGIHISDCDQISVSDSVIGTGDDCLGIIQGATRITVRRVNCGPGHGISIGSLGKYPDEEDVWGVHVNNCTLRDTTNGVRVKTFPFKPDVVPITASGFVFHNIVMESVKNPIIIDQEYCGHGHSCASKPSKIKISDIFFNNIRGTTISPEAVSIKCSSAVPCNSIHLHGIDIKGVKGPASSICINAKIHTAGDLIPPVKC